MSLIPAPDILQERPNASILLVCGPTAMRAAVELLPAYIVGSWATADYFSSEPGEAITNGELKALAGRKVDVWASTRIERWPHHGVLDELQRLGCALRVIEPEPQENIEPGVAKLAGWTAQALIEYARTRVRSIETKTTIATQEVEAEVPRETIESADYPPVSTYEQSFDMPEAEPWEQPIDLWENHPVPRLKPEWLPSALREFVAEQAALTGTDPTIIGISCLVCCAGVIHDGFRVQPKANDTTWTESARLWGAIVGDPSSKKSPGIAKAIKPLKRIEAQNAAAQKCAMAEHEENMRVWERRKGSDKGAPPTKPACDRILCEDTTIESLSDILADNPQGILAFRDELSGWFGGLDAYGKNGSSKDRSFWLEAYNGGPKRIDRVMRGHIYVPNCSVSLLGGIQPDVFAKIIKKLDEDGLLQRFMIVIAGEAVEDSDRIADLHVIQDYDQLISRLHALRPNGEEVFTLSDEAQTVRRTWMESIRQMQRRRAVPAPMLGYVGKWEGLFARLLCVYHVVDAIGSGRRPPAIVEESTAMTVCELMERLLLPHALEFYGNLMYSSDRMFYAQWIAGYILASGRSEISTRDILRFNKAFSRLTEPERKSVWIALEESQWIRDAPGSRTNRRTSLPSRWEINPICHTEFKHRAAEERVQRSAIKEKIADTIRERRQRGDYDESP